MLRSPIHRPLGLKGLLVALGQSARAGEVRKTPRRASTEVTNLKRGFGRGERIRTSGLLVPNQALYQAEPRPDIQTHPV